MQLNGDMLQGGDGGAEVSGVRTQEDIRQTSYY